MKTFVIAIGDRTIHGGRICDLDVRPHFNALRQYMGNVYLDGYVQGGAQYEGVDEGAYVLMGTASDVSTEVIRTLLPAIGRALDQESVGFIVQPDNDTLVFAQEV